MALYESILEQLLDIADEPALPAERHLEKTAPLG